MATVDDCRRALDALAASLANLDPEVRGRHVPDRRIICVVPDLGVTFAGRFRDGGLHDLEQVAEPERVDAQARLTVSSDDLVALGDGRLSFPSAIARGRLKIKASIRDLFNLRSLLG